MGSRLTQYQALWNTRIMDGQTISQQQAPQQPPVPSSHFHLISYFLIGVSMLFVGLGGGYILFGNDGINDSPTPTKVTGVPTKNQIPEPTHTQFIITNSKTNPSWDTYTDKQKGISFDIPSDNFSSENWEVFSLYGLSVMRHRTSTNLYDLNWAMSTDNLTEEKFNSQMYHDPLDPGPNCTPENYGKLPNAGPCITKMRQLPFQVLGYPAIEKQVLSKVSNKIFYVLIAVGDVSVSANGQGKFSESPKYIIRYSANPTDGDIRPSDLTILETITKSLKKITN